MIVYLDASALVKRYVNEPWSSQTIDLTTTAEVVATSLVSRAQVAAALAKAARVRMVSSDAARKAQRAFAQDWPDLARIPITEALVARAETLAWNHGLRGYDAIQLASALAWRDSVGTDVVVATFDAHLWTAVREAGMTAWPDQFTKT
jgi:uncharacterized protein